MIPLKQYDPRRVKTYVGGFLIQNFSEDSMIVIERNNDSFTLTMSADGSGTRSDNADRSGRITLSLMQSSDSNDVLDGFRIVDEVSGGGIVPVVIKDLNGRTLITVLNTWVMKPPTLNRNRNAQAQDWVMETDQLALKIGGN